MSTAVAVVAAVVVVLAGVRAFVVVGLAALRTWAEDRRDQRRLFEGQGRQWGPEGLLAAGQAWTAIVGDGPPSLRLRARGVGAETGTPTTDCPNVDHRQPGKKIEPPSGSQSA